MTSPVDTLGRKAVFCHTSIAQCSDLTDQVSVPVFSAVFTIAAAPPELCSLLGSNLLQNHPGFSPAAARLSSPLIPQILTVRNEPVSKPIWTVGNRQSISGPGFTSVQPYTPLADDLKGTSPNTDQIVLAGVDVLREHVVGVFSVPKKDMSLVLGSPRTAQHRVRLWQYHPRLAFQAFDDARAVDINRERLSDFTFHDQPYVTGRTVLRCCSYFGLGRQRVFVPRVEERAF